MTELTRPPPPIVGKVTHYSVELYWEEALAAATAASKKKKKGDGRIKVCVQEKDSHGDWGNVYGGFAKSHILTGLDPWSQYTYRIRFEYSSDQLSEWSPQIIVSTTKEPLTGDHLHKAIILQDFQQFERILDSGDLTSVDTVDKLGFTPLMAAAQKGSLTADEQADFIEALVSHGADVNFQNESGKTALMLASFAAKLPAIKELLYHGAGLHLQDKGGSTALHWAMDSKNTEVVEFLITKGADLEKEDTNGWTPLLRCAAVNGMRECAELLLKNGAKVDHKDHNGKTALMTAVVNGHKDLVKLLCEKNADLDIQNEFGNTAYEMALSMEKRHVRQALEDFMTSKGIKFHN